MRAGGPRAMQAYRESRTGYESLRKRRLIAAILNDEQMRHAGALKHPGAS